LETLGVFQPLYKTQLLRYKLTEKKTQDQAIYDSSKNIKFVSKTRSYSYKSHEATPHATEPNYTHRGDE